jgi:O-antigen ligase
MDKALSALARHGRLFPLVYLPLVLVLGGGGKWAPLTELACQLLAVLVLLAWLVLRPRHVEPIARPIWLVVTLLVLVPVIQLIPMPPVWWQALPGREVEREALALIGAENSWRPISMAPQRTLEGLLVMLPPFAAMVLIADMGAAERQVMLRVIAAFGLVSVIVGASQLASAGAGLTQFSVHETPGTLYGFQGNRNAQADILLICLLALLAGWHEAARISRTGTLILGTVGLVLVLGTALTGSRTGIVLMGLVLALCLVWLLRERQPGAMRLRAWHLATGAALFAGLTWLALQTRALSQSLARFDFIGEYRPGIWEDTVHAISGHWPVGSGLGTFTWVFGASERLETVGPSYINRAHNEALEVLLEGGLPLAICWLAVAILVGSSLIKALKAKQVMPRSQVVFAGGTLLVTGLHLLVDYPFRSVALATLIGVAAAMVLVPPPAASLVERTGEER